MRGFQSTQNNDEDNTYNRLRDISVVTGAPKPTSREGAWVCRFKPQDKMEDVVKTILKEKGWSDAEINRELQELFPNLRPPGKFIIHANWTTVEEFQRTPWFRRFRPNDSSLTFCSHECMKAIEEELICPSQRGDPYTHLRRHHYETEYMQERFGEPARKSVDRETLAQYTKGAPGEKKTGRKEFLEFEKEYRKKQGSRVVLESEAYRAWLIARNKPKRDPLEDD